MLLHLAGGGGRQDVDEVHHLGHFKPAQAVLAVRQHTGLVRVGIGLALGMLYQISLGVPVDFAGWFGAAVYGLALGITASGVYSAIRNAANPGQG